MPPEQRERYYGRNAKHRGIIPADLPIGSRLWISEVMSRDVVCWAGGSVKGEWGYFYGNPIGNQVRQALAWD